MARSFGATDAEIEIINNTNDEINYIHQKYNEEIRSHWKLPTDEKANIEILEDLKKANPSNAKEIDLILSAMKGTRPQEIVNDEWLGVHEFFLNM